MAAETLLARQAGAVLDRQDRLAFSEREAAAALGVSVRTLFSVRKSGRIRFARIGSRVVYTPEAIRDFLRDSERAAATNVSATETFEGGK